RQALRVSQISSIGFRHGDKVIDKFPENAIRQITRCQPAFSPIFGNVRRLQDNRYSTKPSNRGCKPAAEGHMRVEHVDSISFQQPRELRCFLESPFLSDRYLEKLHVRRHIMPNSLR